MDDLISSRERQNNETEIKKILFDHSRSIDQKMIEIRKIAKNIRLLIGFKTKEEFRETVSMLKANGVSIIALKSYRRPNYFHILAKLHANSPEAQDFIGSFSIKVFGYVNFRIYELEIIIAHGFVVKDKEPLLKYSLTEVNNW